MDLSDTWISILLFFFSDPVARAVTPYQEIESPTLPARPVFAGMPARVPGNLPAPSVHTRPGGPPRSSSRGPMLRSRNVKAPHGTPQQGVLRLPEPTSVTTSDRCLAVAHQPVGRSADGLSRCRAAGVCRSDLLVAPPHCLSP